MVVIWRKVKVVVGLLAFTGFALTESFAFEDADCERMVRVDAAPMQEQLKSSGDFAAARDRAIERSAQDALAQVIGYSVQTSRESRVEVNDEQALQRFRQLDKSDMSGFVRTKIIESGPTKIGDSDAVSVKAEVTVCVPKAEFLQKVAKEKAMRERKAPTRVDAHQAAWFDTKSGEPLLWCWKSKSGYEFFDNDGFHPKNGAKLQPVTSKLFDEWKEEEEKRQQADKARGERQKRAAEEAAEKKRRDAEAAATAEARRVTELAEREKRLSNASELCDQLAANPYDTMKPKGLPGASYELLKSNATQAIEVCEFAVQKNSTEPRYRYQLARAIQISDPGRSLPMYKSLMAQRYAAAYDNYGWALLRTNPQDLGAAISAFRSGSELGDLDSMDSLANLIMQGKAPPRSPGEHIRLLQRASSMGHQPAKLRLLRAEEDLAAQRQQEIQERQGREMFLGVIGGVLQGMQRR